MTEEAQLLAGAGPAAAEAGTTRNPFAVGSFRAWWAASVVAGTGVGIQSVTVPLFIRDRVAEIETQTKTLQQNLEALK